ncbi:MAG: tetratricopeptide repeat protein [Chloroflexi bacterium]|nr:tetratricopeptide repeat protein [Chloroflexota bacterium]
MPQKIDAYRFLGMPRSASAEELEARCQQLLLWLRSDDIPQELRPWAREQASLAESFADALTEEVGGPSSVEVTVASPQAKRAVSGEGGWLRRFYHSPIFFAGLGVLVGVVVLVGVLLVWQRGGSETPGQDTQTEFNAAEFLASQQGRLTELEALVAQQPSNADALFELGEINMMGEQWEKAILWFNKLLTAAPDSQYAEHVQIDIALATMSLGRYTEAEPLFLKVLEKDPGNIQVHFSLGFLYASSATPDMRQAVQHWQEVVRLDPDSEWGQIAQSHLEQVGALLPTPFSTPTPAATP